MKDSDYHDLTELVKTKKSDDLVASFIVVSLLFITLFLLLLSSFSHGLIWLITQFFLGLNILQWFFILHDTAHGHFFTTKKVNIFVGHLSSIFVILPFYPWKYIHRTHHLWIGYKDKDPTQKLLTRKDIPEKREKIINFCWKYWIPIFTLSFSVDNFWNIKKLNLLYPEKRNKNYFSIAVPVLIQLYFLTSMGPLHYLKVWGLAYLFFLILCDPLLLSQHSGKKQMIAGDSKVTMIHLKNQDEFTRSLSFPGFINKFIMLGFNYHSLHHLFPTLPGYNLIELDYRDNTFVDWKTWIKESKSLKGVDLLYSDEINLK